MPDEGKINTAGGILLSLKTKHLICWYKPWTHEEIIFKI